MNDFDWAQAKDTQPSKIICQKIVENLVEIQKPEKAAKFVEDERKIKLFSL